MAQPQHTRNEAHSGKRVLEYLGAGHTSVFEKYMDERARGVTVLLADGTAVPLPPLPFDGYPTPAFERYSDFWSTNPGPNVASFGRGLADYSNVGFFTPVSNYGNTNYPYPTGRVDAVPARRCAGSLHRLELEHPPHDGKRMEWAPHG